MHSWGDENVDWEGINDAAEFIGEGLKTYARVGVMQYKEKFGTVRVYCSFGASMIYSLWRPGYAWIPRWWPMRLDFWLSNLLLSGWVNQHIIVPFQQRAYVWFYHKAVQRWPHLYEEIVSSADWGELFEGHIPGYKHSDYWRTVE